MALNKEQALDAVRNIYAGPRLVEAGRLQRISDALRPQQPGEVPRVTLPKDAAKTMQALARKSHTNYLPLVVDTFSQVMKVDNYFSQGSSESAGPWKYWQRNRMDARQTGVHRAGLQYGASYVVTLPGTDGPVINGVSPRAMTAVYANPADDEWPMLALHVDGDMMRLYDEENVHFIGKENPYRGTFGDPSATAQLGANRITFIETRTHGVGVCPVTRFRDRMLLEGEEQYGIIEPLLSLQERLDETNFGMLVAQFYSAFKQRYVIGWVPKSEREELQAGAADLWTFESDKVKVGTIDPTDPMGYIKSKESGIRDLSAIAQLPAQNLGVDGISNISDATLAGLEVAKDRRADEITTSFGESWEQALRLCAHIDGDSDSAGDFAAEVKWKDSTARSFAQAIDGLGKIATMLGVPAEALLEDIPGWSGSKVDRVKALIREQDPVRAMTDRIEQRAVAQPLS